MDLSRIADLDPNCIFNHTTDGYCVFRKHCAVRVNNKNQWFFWHDTYKSDARCDPQGLPIFVPADVQAVLDILVKYDHSNNNTKGSPMPALDWDKR